MKINKNNIIGLILSSFLLLPIYSCVDDDLDINGGGAEKGEASTYITLSMNLPAMTRDASSDASEKEVHEEYEDYLDTDKLHLLFFYGDEKDDHYNKLFKIFEPGELSLIPIGSEDRGTTNNWYVRMPIYDYNDDFARTLRTKKFKIAALANWTKERFNQYMTVEVRDKDGNVITEGSDINMLHHLVVDNSYAKTDDKDKVTPKDSYAFLMKDYGNKMGLYQSWVKQKQGDPDLKDTESYRKWIRENWDPALSENPTLEQHNAGKAYQYDTMSDLWLLWNFGGTVIDNALPYGETFENDPSMSDDVKNKWQTRFGLKHYQWVTAGLNTNQNPDYAEGNINDLEMDENNPPSNEVNPLRFKTNSNCKAVRFSKGNRKYYYGVRLHKIPEYLGGKTSTSDGDRLDPEKNDGYFSFIARATGTLFITARNAKTTIEENDLDSKSKEPKSAKLEIQVGYSTNKTTFSYVVAGGVKTYSTKISITQGEQPIYIFNNSTNSSSNPYDIDILEIEYIQDEYAYGIDRKGIDPKDQPIPMYGVQVYEPLTLWKEGTVFDMSNFNNLGPQSYMDASGQEITPYEFRKIQLVRSVAKVELKIPSSMTPHHVFLRCMNKKSRLEPMDVSSPTNQIWVDYNERIHSKDCEWEHLLGHEPFYNNETYTYQEQLAWFYGSWAKENEPIGGIYVPENIKFGKEDDATDKYPRIINPMIERSDFCEFLYAGKTGIYDKYVLYVPEKFVDDPNDEGDVKSDPKVCHIEFRAYDFPYTNLDDNWCYRIYFTKDGYNSQYAGENSKLPDSGKKDEKDEAGNIINTIDNTWENVYEKNIDNLKEHWPIMRNHLYSFTVADEHTGVLVVKLEVLPWKDVQDNKYNW